MIIKSAITDRVINSEYVISSMIRGDKIFLTVEGMGELAVFMSDDFELVKDVFDKFVLREWLGGAALFDFGDYVEE